MIKIIFFTLLIIVICFVVAAMIAGYLDRKKIEKILMLDLEKYFPASKTQEREREKATEVLMEFGYLYSPYILGFKPFFTNPPVNWYKQTENFIEEMKFYKSQKINEKAYQLIYKIVKVKYIIENQIEYFEKNIDDAENVYLEIEKNSEIKSYFPELYNFRLYSLTKFIEHTEKVIEQLESQQDKYEDAVDELSKIKRRTIFQASTQFTWNLLTAPVRRVVNLVDGIITDDEAKIDKNLTMLIFGGIGIGILSEAIDALDAMDSVGTTSVNQVAGDVEWGNPGTHFIEPHERELENGRTIWVDGDGDTSVDRTVEEGGGYYRTNPDGNLHNNLNS